MSYPRPRIAAAALVACAMLAGCTSTPSVRSDYDKAADFGKYRTFGFVDQTDQAKSLVMQELEAAATREMEARGYRLAEQPDLIVNFTGKLEDRTDVQSVPGPYYGPTWGYGGWYGAPYGAWGYGGSQVTTRHYKVGELVMDIVDREKRMVVFQAGLERTVTKEMQQHRSQALTQAVKLLFGTYPFVAGQSGPVAPVEKK
ncbi:MAG TPA: DUF4136 domain-containing protein [Steroidobacteraceae bacterium]|nr:DUF4136 domain-containing protein [Steroidobacteraceae bacterium]